MTQGFDEYREKLNTVQLLMSANCCRHAYEAGQQSRQAEIDELKKRIDEALVLCEKGCVLKAMSVLKGTNQ